MTYDDFIFLINNRYVKVIFKVKDYKHYIIYTMHKEINIHEKL